MKKTLLTTLMAGTMALTLSALFSVPAMAACPYREFSSDQQEHQFYF